MKILAAAALSLTFVQAQHPGMGAHVMGFDQDKTTHRFLLYEDGGAIDISVKSADDAKNREAIRAHLPHIALLFGEGDFSAPMLVHETKDVPGAKDLARLKGRIIYTYAETPAGGRVNIVSKDREAITAVHTFLKYQITEHRTGDSMVPARRK